MLHIGITGGIGGGKSTVCRIFELLEIPVFYADDEAKDLMDNNPDLIASIKHAFGSDIYLPSGTLNRKKLAAIVFNNKKDLDRLNGLVHPAVFVAYKHWSSMQRSPYVIKEAAILFESGSYKECDHTILVTAPESLRIARVVNRDGVGPEQVRARIGKQLPEDDKAALADFVILNDGMTALIPQVLSIHAAILKAMRNG